MNQLLLRPTEVAAALGISRSSTYELIRSGALPGVIKIGRRVRISAAALGEWIRRQTDLST